MARKPKKRLGERAIKGKVAVTPLLCRLYKTLTEVKNMETQIQVGSVKTITEIVERIKLLEDFKAELQKHKDWEGIHRLEGKLEQLYWVLGVKV